MCEVSKLVTIQNPRKLLLKKKLKKRLNTEISMLRKNWSTLFITVSKDFLPLQSNSFVSLKAVQHFISQNLEAIDHPVPEIKNYNDRHVAFPHKYTWILWHNYTLWHEKNREYGFMFLQLSILRTPACHLSNMALRTITTLKAIIQTERNNIRIKFKIKSALYALQAHGLRIDKVPHDISWLTYFGLVIIFSKIL